MKFWAVWETVFHDTQGDISKYDYISELPTELPGESSRISPEVKHNIIYFGVDYGAWVDRGNFVPIQSFLHLKVPRYRDFDVTVKVEIPSAAKTLDLGKTENKSYWFGISVRALSIYMWSAYLFYIRKDGRIEFGIHEAGNPIEKPPRIPEVAEQPVTLRIKAEKDRIQTWANGRPRHDERDGERRFIRRGDIYLISYGVRAKIHEVEVKVKKWHAPLVRFFRKTWKILVIIGVILGIITGVIALHQFLTRPG